MEIITNTCSIVNGKKVVIIDSFQARFLQAKELRGLRWIDIAHESGLSKAQISQYKNGVHEPEQYALYQLANTLNVNIEWLMGMDVPMEKLVSVKNADVLNRYQELNDIGKAEFVRLLDALLSDEFYKR
ncbi:helix-turn-helix domain-containing protein [Anaerosporobacter sp.]|uniref:helix-turn-helix domain-containing protein n=1 Tax=Anaerosporobacter sp. TaxID=1872529 RepID=UPI00286EDB06|nr:helix-turn-helix domain-containing protein [Anaerosporobacter sp.]